MPWEGFNFEDAVLINNKILSKYTSLHIEKYDLEIAESGLEKITSNIPGISPKNLQKLDKNGVVQIGSWVTEGDILVGKIIPIAPLTQNILTHEKLLYDIVVFGQKDRQIQERCLRVPQGVSGRIIRISYTHQQKDPISPKKHFFETMLNFQSLLNFSNKKRKLARSQRALRSNPAKGRWSVNVSADGAFEVGQFQGLPLERNQQPFLFPKKMDSKNRWHSRKKFMAELGRLPNGARHAHWAKPTPAPLWPSGPKGCRFAIEKEKDRQRQSLWGYSARKHAQNPLETNLKINLKFP